MSFRYYGLIILILLAVFVIVNGPVIFQEGNPLPLFSGIIRLQFTNEGVVEISEKKLLQKTDDDELLNSYLKDRGWEFKDRLGAGIFYERDGEDLFFHSRMFTSYYIVHEAEKPFN